MLQCTRYYKPSPQEKALAATKAAIQDKVGEDNLPDMIYVHGCHSTMQVQGKYPLHARLLGVSMAALVHYICTRVQDTVAAQSAGLICFNLGYLPSADNRDDTATQCQTTVSAVVAALNTVGKQGLISIMAYTGHQGKQDCCMPASRGLYCIEHKSTKCALLQYNIDILALAGGQEEYEAVRLQLLGLCPARWTVTEHRYINRPAAPILIYVVPKEGNRDKP